MSDLITLEWNKKEEVATLWLNRPEVHNAFNPNFMKDILDTLKQLEKKTNLKVLVLRGKGASFCAGADLQWMQKLKKTTLNENKKDAKKLREFFLRINQFPVPVIASVHGAVLGGGIGLVTVCDYVIADSATKFAFSEVRLGLVPAVISPFVISKIGYSFARAMFLNGRLFGTEEALRMGLIHEVVLENKMEVKLQERIQEFLRTGREASRAGKKLLLDLPNIKNVEAYTTNLIAKLRVSAEGQEGMTALLERRSPNWVNHED